MVRGFQENAMASDLLVFSQFAARSIREVEGILASYYSQSEQLDGMFACAVTGHGKV